MATIMRTVPILLLALLAACGLPTDAKKQAEALPQAISNAAGFMEERRKALEMQLAEAPEWKPYAAREKWTEKFGLAAADLIRAREVVSKEVDPVVKADKSADREKLFALIKRTDGIINGARQSSRMPETRLAFLKDAKAKAPERVLEVAKLYLETARHNHALTPLVEKYRKAYPARTDEITKRATPTTSAYRASEIANNQVAAEARKIEANEADWAKLADSHAIVVKGHADMKATRPKLEKDLASLDKSYSKILIDMRAEYKACISRVSWQESESIEWPKETTYDYPCKAVSEDAHETADEFDDRDYEFAVFTWSYWSGKKTRLYKTGEVTEADVVQLWKELDIVPDANWPRGDNEANFHVRATEAHYFHRYSIVENGVKKDGAWEEVSAKFYDEHDEHLGMSLVEKAYGFFEDETVKVPSPPGMAHVGDEKTGRWENRGGNTVWVWWPYYHSTYGGYYGPGWGGYSRTDWDSWRTERRAGRTYTGNGQYGSGGSATRTGRLAESEFAKRGGFKEASAPMRGAGPANRSGGPQRGGK